MKSKLEKLLKESEDLTNKVNELRIKRKRLGAEFAATGSALITSKKKVKLLSVEISKARDEAQKVATKKRKSSGNKSTVKTTEKSSEK